MSSGCGSLADPEAVGPSVYVVHHWDADGVATAALYARRLRGRLAGTATPSIGLYTWRAVPRPPAGADAVLVLDYGIPGPDYEALEDAVAPRRLLVLDHHRVLPPRLRRGAYCNPAATRGEAWGAASHLAHSLLGGGGRVDAGLAALGLVGDLQPYLDAGQPHPGLREAERLAAEAGLGLEELREAAVSVDSCYRLLDTQCLAEAVRLAAEHGVRGLLSSQRLREARERAGRLAEEALRLLRGPEEPAPGILLYRLDMDAYVTSLVGRRLAAENPDAVVVLVHRFPREGRGFIYARSVTLSLAAALEELRRRGIRVGGKESVIVAEFAGDPGRVLGEALRALQASLKP